MLVAQEKESKLSLDRTLAAIDKVTSESLDGYRFFGSNIRVTSSSKLLILIFQAQNLMEVKNKLRAKLLIASGGEDTSPLEQEIRWRTMTKYKFLTIFKNNSP